MLVNIFQNKRDIWMSYRDEKIRVLKQLRCSRQCVFFVVVEVSGG